MGLGGGSRFIFQTYIIRLPGPGTLRREICVYTYNLCIITYYYRERNIYTYKETYRHMSMALCLFAYVCLPIDLFLEREREGGEREGERRGGRWREREREGDTEGGRNGGRQCN